MTVTSDLEPTTFWQKLVLTFLRRLWLLLFILVVLILVGLVRDTFFEG